MDCTWDQEGPDASPMSIKIYSYNLIQEEKEEREAIVTPQSLICVHHLHHLSPDLSIVS